MYSIKDSVTSTETYKEKKTKKNVVSGHKEQFGLKEWRPHVCTHILDMVETQRSSFAGVLQRLGGESLIVAMEKTETKREHKSEWLN